jgi:hypothetical protein
VVGVSLVYFSYLAGVAAFRRSVPFGRRLRVFVIALLVIAALLLIGEWHVVPLLYLIIGYWLPALLVTNADDRLGRRLLAFDHQLFGVDGLPRFASGAPRALIGYLELSYLLCYAVVPAGWIWLVASGHGEHAGRFWTTVLLASFGCYGVLPWLATRAPRAV